MPPLRKDALDLDQWRQLDYSNDPDDWTRLGTFIMWRALSDACTGLSLEHLRHWKSHSLAGQPYPYFEFLRQFCRNGLDEANIVQYDLNHFVYSIWCQQLCGAVGLEHQILLKVYQRALYDFPYRRSLARRLHGLWNGSIGPHSKRRRKGHVQEHFFWVRGTERQKCSTMLAM